MQLFRIQCLLRFQRDVRLHAFHGKALSALLDNAISDARKGERDPGRALVVDAPEQARTHLKAGEDYAFGITVFAVDATNASARIHQLRAGLGRLAERAAKPGVAIGGNFQLLHLTDLVTGCILCPGDSPTPIPAAQVQADLQRLVGRPRLSLRFTTPLRISRPTALRNEEGGHNYLDRDWFSPGVLFEGLFRRLQTLRILPPPAVPPAPTELRTAENRLVWMSVSWGERGRRKTLGGAVGRIVLDAPPPDWLPWLVWGQYTHVGLATNMGFGRYQIEELGPPRYPCRRAVSLMQLAFPPSHSSDSNHAPDARPDAASAKDVQSIHDGTFEPQPHSRIAIPKSPSEFRTLCVPSARDRALQRRIVDLIAPALDSFFESSSFAYRRGLGRFAAARALRDAFRQGYCYAVKADVANYYDSIDHAELEVRLDAYLADDELTGLIMKFVRAAAPKPGCGIPTGAPLSPLLSNLFLDQFDEEIARAGGRLIRYADDFLILARDRDRAETLLREARQAAEALKLALNHRKTAILDLREPFDFLGLRFVKRGRWSYEKSARLLSVDDLNWYEAEPQSRAAALALPGESPVGAADSGQAVVVFGPAGGLRSPSSPTQRGGACSNALRVIQYCVRIGERQWHEMHIERRARRLFPR